MLPLMPDPWRSLFEVARYAPSPHNVQPWKLTILDAQRADLYVDRARTLPAEDKTGSFIISAMAMFAEGLRMVAMNHGCHLKVDATLPDLTQRYARYATLKLQPGATPPSPPIPTNSSFCAAHPGYRRDRI